MYAPTLTGIALALAVGFAAAPGFAQTATTPNSDTKGGLQDDTGMATLGVDISAAGSTKSEIDTFVAALPADQAEKVKTGCDTVVANQDNQNPKVLSFCQAVTGKM